MERVCRANGQGQTTKKTTRIQARGISISWETLTPLFWSVDMEQANSLTGVVDDDDDDDNDDDNSVYTVGD